MDPTDDKSICAREFRQSIRPIRLGDAMISRPHICGFFNSHDDEYRTVLPFIKEGLECGEKAVYTIDPERHDEHLERLARAGIDVVAARERSQFELRSWANTHLRNGRFDRDKTLALFADIVTDAKRQGFPLIRFVIHMEWALAK